VLLDAVPRCVDQRGVCDELAAQSITASCLDTCAMSTRDCSSLEPLWDVEDVD
jgi:hypothetical protein